MSQIEGRLTTCTVCGKTVFSELLDGNTFQNGGYRSRNEMFQDLPKGWVHTETKIFDESLPVGDLCPSCRQRLVDALKREINTIINTPDEA